MITQRKSKTLAVHPVEVSRYRSWTIYGRSGTGKTTLASTFPKPLLLVDVGDRGTDSISDVRNLDVMTVTNWDEFEDMYWWLHAHPGSYKTLVIDTISQWQDLAIAKVQQGQRTTPSLAPPVTKRDWGHIAALMKSWIINVRDLPMDVVFIAQDRTFNIDEEEGVGSQLAPEVGPRLIPSVASHLNAAVSIIGCTFIRREITRQKITANKTKEVAVTQYCLRIGPNPVYITKIRKPKAVELPEVIINPDYASVVKFIRGGK